MKLSEKKIILGVGFTIDSEIKILEYIAEKVAKRVGKVMVLTPNPEMLILARKDKHFRTVLNSAEIALPDGMGVVKASKVLGKGIDARITGVDFMEKLIKTASSELPKMQNRQASIGFIGGREKVAERAAICLEKKYPGANFFVYSEDIDAKNFNFQTVKFKKIQDGGLSEFFPKKLDILFVAFGFPTQEKWINARLPHIPVTCAMGVGGAFDIISGKTKRAPRVLQSAGLEWFWRLAHQPWRIRRQIKLIQFPFLVLQEKFAR